MYRPSPTLREGKEARRKERSYSNDKHRRRAFRWTLRRPLLFCLLGTLAFLIWICRSDGGAVVEVEPDPVVAEELQVVPMLRIPAGSLTKKEFFEQYGNKTVIIEGGLRHHPAAKLGLEGLRKVCAGSNIETYVYDPRSKQWGGHVDKKALPFEDYIDKYVLNETNSEKRYFPGGDQGIPLLCPTLELLAPIPNYVSFGLAEESAVAFYNCKQLLNKTGTGEPGDCFRPLVASQPELFVGPGGTKTEMHMDNNPNAFWMSVYFGKKMFRTISYEDSIKHMPYYKEKGAIRMERRKGGQIRKQQLEIWNPDLETFPELKKVTVWEGTVSAGDWIYLPPATLHGVYNPEPFWALTSMDIYPPLFDKFLDVCVDTDYMGRCQESILEIGERKCNPKKFSQRKDLKKCLRDSPYLHFVEKQYNEFQSKDQFVHELAGFDSFQPWCEAICELKKNYKNVCACTKSLNDNGTISNL